MPDLVKTVIEAIAALFILFIFGTLVLPELAKATGQSMALFTISLILIGIGVVASVFAVIVKVMR